MTQPRLLTVIGTRPQFIKYASLRSALDGRFSETLVDTGQHWDHALSTGFLEEFSVREPDHVLDAGGGSASTQVAAVLDALEDVVEAESPDRLLCMGDTNTTLAGALVGAQAGLPVAHLEAGERNFDGDGRQIAPWSTPEEINRTMVDRISSLLLCASRRAVDNLEREGAFGEVVRTGDIMYDLFLRQEDPGREVLDELDLTPGGYHYATVHRASNTDDPRRLEGIFSALRRLDLPVVIPLHPRTEKMLRRFGQWEDVRGADGLQIVEPVAYAESIALGRHADVVITDSGGVVREAYFAGVPAVIVDDKTAWIDLVEAGAATLAGTDADAVRRAVERTSDATAEQGLLGEGDAGERVARALEAWFDGRPATPGEAARAT